MPNVYEERPEIGRASAAFRLEQLEAFLQIEPKLCGVVILPFTPRMAMELELAGNAFLIGGTATAEDALQFIHRISASYSSSDGDQVTRLSKDLFDQKPVAEIEAYLKRTHLASESFADPNEETRRSPSDASWMSPLVDIFCRRYSWTINQVLDTPYRILWQQMNRIIEEQKPDYIQRAPEVMRIRLEFLKEQQAKIDIERAARAARGGRRGS